MPHIELPQAEFKVVLLGDTNTGKTSLALRFVEGYYKESGRSPTVGAFFLTKRITVHQTTTCKLLLWDTAGQAQFQKLAQTYYQQAAAAIFTYDVSQPQSLHRLRVFLDEVLQNTAGRRMALAIVACKTDLDATLHHPGLAEEAQQLAAAHHALYVATSAKTGEGVQSLFEQTAERVWQYQREAQVGSGLPIPVMVGGTISSRAALLQKQQKHKHEPVSPVAEAPAVRARAPTLQTLDSSGDDDEDDPSDDHVVQDGTEKNPIICEGMLSCADVPGKGCCIC